MDQIVTIDAHNTLKTDSLASSHPIYIPVNHPDEIGEMFDSVSYGKVSRTIICAVCHLDTVLHGMLNTKLWVSFRKILFADKATSTIRKSTYIKIVLLLIMLSNRYVEFKVVFVVVATNTPLRFGGKQTLVIEKFKFDRQAFSVVNSRTAFFPWHSATEFSCQSWEK